MVPERAKRKAPNLPHDRFVDAADVLTRVRNDSSAWTMRNENQRSALLGVAIGRHKSVVGLFRRQSALHVNGGFGRRGGPPEHDHRISSGPSISSDTNKQRESATK